MRGVERTRSAEKGKECGGEGEHGGKADQAGKGFQQSVKMLRGEENRRQMMMKLRR